METWRSLQMLWNVVVTQVNDLWLDCRTYKNADISDWAVKCVMCYVTLYVCPPWVSCLLQLSSVSVRDSVMCTKLLLCELAEKVVAAKALREVHTQ